MAVETNLSTKLPVADRTREAEEESSVGGALAVAFRWARSMYTLHPCPFQDFCV